MGTADVIPGVSGGTVALIMGIYDELVGTIASIDQRVVGALMRGRIAGVLRLINATFLIPLLFGIGMAIVSLAKLITWLLATHPQPVWGLFTGLITLGTMVQVSNAFSRVHGGFALFLHNWTTITELRSIWKRLHVRRRNKCVRPRHCV